MLKIFRKIKESLEPVPDANVLIAEIHNEFDTSAFKLLNEANEILSKSIDTGKGERLRKIGFVQSSKAIEAVSILKTKEEKTALAELIEYYTIHYPNNKFITEEMVKSICKKYGLLMALVSYYIGDVPEKNLSEIELFKLREEDSLKIPYGYYKWEVHQNTRMPYPVMAFKETENATYGYIEIGGFGYSIRKVSDKSLTHHYTKDPFKICASVKDFNTADMKIEDGYKLNVNLPDPIVLQPVQGGYLIVSKWGLESSDESLINEQLN